MVINVLERFPDLFSFYSHEMTPYSLNLVVIFYVDFDMVLIYNYLKINHTLIWSREARKG